MTKTIWEIGASCMREKYTKEDFAEFKKNNIKYAELSPLFNMKGLDYARELFNSIDLKSLKRYAEENGVTINSFHLPFDHNHINPASFDKNVRENTIEFDRELIEKTVALGTKIFVIHPSGEPLEEHERKESLKYSCESIARLADIAHTYNAVIAVENLPRTCIGRSSSDIAEILSFNNKLRVCFDVNHLLSESHKDFVKNVGNKIITLHISDYDFINERHWLPGKGQIDWNELIALLQTVGYSGPFMNEIRYREESNTDEEFVTLAELKAANLAIFENL